MKLAMIALVCFFLLASAFFVSMCLLMMYVCVAKSEVKFSIKTLSGLVQGCAGNMMLLLRKSWYVVRNFPAIFLKWKDGRVAHRVYQQYRTAMKRTIRNNNLIAIEPDVDVRKRYDKMSHNDLKREGMELQLRLDLYRLLYGDKLNDHIVIDIPSPVKKKGTFAVKGKKIVKV